MPDKEKSRFQWPIVGNSGVVGYLQNNLTSLQINHAYLFVGPRSIGKTTVVKHFINSLICENLSKEKQVPCNECQCCKQVANEIHPDITWVEREINEKTEKLKKNISIEQIRKLQDKLNLHSFLNSYKIAVIQEAESLSTEAANSLLKTLEEPFSKTVIILLTTSIYSLPQTIVSRCQQLNFLPTSTKEIFDHLISIKTDRKKAKTLAALSFGRPGIAINYLDEPERYLDFKDEAKRFLSLIKTSNLNERFKIVGSLAGFNDFDTIRGVLSIWTKVLRDLILIQANNNGLVTNLYLLTELEKLVGTYSQKELKRILEMINSIKRQLELNINYKLALENLVLNF